jgi:hypothetical protein
MNLLKAGAAVPAFFESIRAEILIFKTISVTSPSNK